MNSNNLETGYILLFKNNNLLSNLVKFVTRSEYSHAAIAYKNLDGRFFIAESLAWGVSLNAIDIYDHKDYDVFVARHNLPDSLIRQRIIERVNKPYDYWGLIGAFFVSIKLWAKNFLQKDKALYCNETVSQVLGLNNVNTPADLAIHPKVRKVNKNQMNKINNYGIKELTPLTLKNHGVEITPQFILVTPEKINFYSEFVIETIINNHNEELKKAKTNQNEKFGEILAENEKLKRELQELKAPVPTAEGVN